MADKIVLNLPRYKGEYELDLEDSPLTNLEWRWVKKISGYLPLTMADGWKGGDPDLFVAFAVVAMARAGRIQKEEALTVADSLMDAPFDGASITFVGEEADADDPPAEPATTPETDKPLRSIGASTSAPTSASPDVDLSRTGALA
jgi:hypothetical protein